MENNRYCSLVSDRISELQKELSNLQVKANKEVNNDILAKLQLKMDVIRGKIKYLKSIELLPLYVSVSILKNAKIYDKVTNRYITFEDFQSRLGLNNVREVMSRSKVTTLSYLKELFIDDYDSMYDLISLQNSNFILSEKIRTLYNKGEKSIMMLGIKENKIIKLESKTNELIKDLESDYNIFTLKEINYLIRNSDVKLSREFILKHKDKVILNNPEMVKVVKTLEFSDKFKFISKFFKSKRNKYEDKFISSVKDFYLNDNRLSNLGLSSNKNMLDSYSSIREFTNNLNAKINSKRNEFKILKDTVKKLRATTMSEINKCESNKEEKKKQFMDLLKSKTNFLPKLFQEQLWNEPELKSSMIKLSCIKEEKVLLDKINSYNLPTVSLVKDIENEPVKTNTKVRRLVA